MARGNFWEMTYDPNWEGPTEVVSLRDLDGSSGLVDRRVATADGRTVSVRWKTSGPVRLFQRCDIAETVKDSLVSNCEFVRCRFRGSRWENVKFSNCIFERCDFSDVIFLGSYFVSDCKFQHNSASAELFRIEETAISARAFMNGLETNLEHTDKVEYQRHRFVGTRQKIAKSLFSATRNESDVDYYFEAYEQLVRSTLEQHVEQHRILNDERFQPTWRFLVMSAPARMERRAVLISGWLTEWGRSLLRSFGFFVVTVAFFAILYRQMDPVPATATRAQIFLDPIIRALNVTLVAGYTAEYDSGASLLLKLVQVCNLLLGIFWYSLVVPVLSRRVLR